jgi:hypothetical protein
VTLAFVPLRLHFVARDPIHFPQGQPANVLRGGFGVTLKRIAPAEMYARLFEPKLQGGPSGLADAPRPFVLRARHLDGWLIAPGETFHFAVNIFDTRDDSVSCFPQVFSELARRGLGPSRGRAELQQVDRSLELLSFAPASGSVGGVRVLFLTPTELKSEDRIVARPEFPVLFGRIRDRLSTLSALYGSGPLAIDFQATGERAAQVRLTRCELAPVEIERRSSRTGQTHPIGGFIGEAEYEGELAEFLPYLEAARWTGVGRQTVWGKGEIAVDSIKQS